MRVLSVVKTFFSIIALVLIFQMYGCNEKQSYIPYAPVQFTVNLNRFNDLTSTGFSMLYPQAGYGGVIIYCQYYDIATPSNSIYYAYDATCTLEVNDSCSVVNEGNGLNAVCPCCGSTYSLMDGFPINGEAPYALKQYNISLFDNTLHISN